MKPDRPTCTLLRGGIRPFAVSLDHVGPIARSVDDLRILFDAMQIPEFPKWDWGTPNWAESAPVLGRLRGFFDRRAEAAIALALDDAVRALAAGGAKIVELDDPIDFERIVRDHRTVMATEAAGVHSEGLDQFPEHYPQHIRDLILEGQSRRALEYFHAREGMTPSRDKLLSAFVEKGAEFWITPATIGTAPDPSTTGDPAFNSPWSYTGLPTVSFPIGLAADGLPVAIQLIGWTHRDGPLLHAAQWCEQVIRAWRQ
jgi:aspartyl-tRNA(Asn)/glutamyl-tRNA(Gln) amidotransferase subunit A